MNDRVKDDWLAAEAQSLLSASSDGFISWRPGGVVLSADEGACRLLGMPRSRLVGAAFSALMASDEGRRVARVLHDSEHSGRVTFRLSPRIGKAPVVIELSFVRDDSGACCYLGSLREVHTDADLEQRCAILQEMLTKQARDQGLAVQIAGLVATQIELSIVLPGIIDIALPRFDADAGWVKIPGPSPGDLPTIMGARGISPEFVKAEQATPISECSICASLLKGGQMASSPLPIAMCPRIATQPDLCSELAYHIGVPIRVASSVYGILEIGWRRRPPDIASERSVLLAIGQQMGVALQNARLREQVRAAAVHGERARLARQLHDSVTQSLYSLALLAEGWRRLAENGQLPSIDTALTRVKHIAHDALKEMRLMVFELRPPELRQEGLAGALRHRLDVVEMRTGLEVSINIEPGLSLPARVEEELYRITIEALNNALKHADASIVTVRLAPCAEGVTLEVADDGLGFDPQSPRGHGGVGLRSMRERAELIHADLVIDSALGSGTRIQVRVPRAVVTGRIEAGR